jgi:hypothetical protein
MPTKKKFFLFITVLFEGTFTSVSVEKKVSKKPQNSRNLGFPNFVWNVPDPDPYKIMPDPIIGAQGTVPGNWNPAF